MSYILTSVAGAGIGLLISVLLLRSRGIRFGEQFESAPGDGSVTPCSYWKGLVPLTILGLIIGLLIKLS